MHNKYSKTLAAFIVLLLSIGLPHALAQGADNGKNKLRKIPPQAASGEISPSQKDRKALGQSVSLIAQQLGGKGNFDVRNDKQHKNARRTLHANQKVNGLQVYGAGLVVNLDANGLVVAVSGGIVDKTDLPRNAKVASAAATATAKEGLAEATTPEKKTEKAYVVNRYGDVVLAWKVVVEHMSSKGPQRDAIFVDATSGGIAAIHPQYKYAASLETRDCQETTNSCVLESTSSAEINTGDLALDSAHNYAKATYDYYFNTFGRDSIDDSGMTLKSRVHYDRNYNNAFWDGAQMTYGDGDGTTFAPLSQDADVVAHELTHGVTEFTSGLIYSYESGALNEALSDIFGAMVDRQEGATGDDIWLLGEDIYTPGTPGDGLRNMADPESEGDYDYYPTRYTGSGDYGGVHINSGIANLAFVLLADGGIDGGTHPRNKTSTVVPTIGFEAAAAIFYYANTQCLFASSNFEGARDCTAEGAAALGYSQAEIDAVHLAWDAVGVPGGPPNPNAVTAIDIPGLSGSRSSTRFYEFAVPAGAADLRVEIFGGSGDADLYTRRGAPPTTSAYDCRPYIAGNNETCSVATPQADTYHIMIRGYSAYSGVGLVVSYVGAGEPQNSPPVADFGSAASGLSVDFMDLSSDSDGTVTAWTWDFGDDSTSDLEGPEHTYAASNNYTVSLTVTDDDVDDPRSDTTIKTITVILDTDSDGVADDGDDSCPATPSGEDVDSTGCSESQKDDDNDGIFNISDQCPATPSDEEADSTGCSESQKDDDGDGVANDIDLCPDTPADDTVDADGCTPPPPPVACNGSEQRSYNRIRSGRSESFDVNVPGCAATVTVTTTARRGNLDLYVDGDACNTNGTSNERCTFGSGGGHEIELRAVSNVSKVVVEVVWN